jgi:drug/metabolite transporter (DMT)-like permease
MVVVKPTRQRAQRRAAEADLGFGWGPANSLLLALAAVVLGAGYVALAKGSITLAPALLAVGYCVLIPGSLLIRGRKAGSGE